MSLEDLLETHIQGSRPTVPDELSQDFHRAVKAHEALLYALGETLVVPDEDPGERSPPALPDDYEIVRELGRGGMGIVYLVRQKSLGRMVALKVLRPGAMTFGPLLQRFLGEAQHLARLRHPNIVSIHEIGKAAEEPYFTMDYVEGEPLSAIVARGPLSPSRALAILKQAAEGVLHAHEAGIIHRDLKPGNVLVDSRGSAYVTDFGLARDMTRTCELTRSGEVMGTPAYMAPEQAQGRTDLIGEATDVHALGVILYEMLTGRPPYGRDAPASVLVRLLREEPLAPRRIDRRVPRDLETICLKAMAKAAGSRYPTVRAFLEDIRLFESGQTVRARRPGVVIRSACMVRRRWKAAALVLSTGLAAAVAGALLSARGLEDLVAEGDGLHSGGDHIQAAAVYRRALRRASAPLDLFVLERLVRCTSEAGRREESLEAGLELIALDPAAWLGDLNHPLAMAVAARLAAAPAGEDAGPPPARRALLELVRTRLEISLGGPRLAEAERQAAAAALEGVLAELGGEQPAPPPGEREGAGGPAGDPGALLERARDEKVPARERAALAQAAGEAYEASGDRSAALEAYRRAFSLLRPVHPVVAGLTNGTLDTARPRSLAPEAPGSARLRALLRSVRRLDPGSVEARGGLRIRITGLDLPPELGLNLLVSLRDAAVEAGGPDAAASLGQAPVQLDQAAWIGVASGRYRLRIEPGGRGVRSMGRHGARASRFLSMLELDLGSLPEEVEVRDRAIDLSIPARLLEEIVPLEPLGGEVDLSRATFRWSGLPGAVSYEVELFDVSELGGGIYYKPARKFKAEGTSLRLAGAQPLTPRGESRLEKGGTATWVVRALDREGKCIGRFAAAAPAFTISGALEGP